MGLGLTSASPRASWLGLPNNTNTSWWKDPGMRKANLIILCYMIAQATGGYDKSLINNLQSMPNWVEKLGEPTSGTLGIITASLSIGLGAAAPFFGWLSDWRGRKICMWTGCLIMLVGAIIQSAANGRAMFVVGRVLLGIGNAGTLCAGPLLAAELAHPRQRGVVTSLYNTFWYVGSIICAWLSFGTSYISDSDWAWRIPCIGQALPSAVLLLICWWLPESPRFMVQKGRTDEALKLLASFHANGDVEDPLVLFELREIQEAIELANSVPSKGWLKDWAELFATKANRRRMFIIIVLVIGIDWCGTSVTSYYILAQVGISSSTQQTGINGGLQIFNWITAMIGALLADNLGRRTLWLLSFGLMLAFNIPFAACSAVYAEKANTAAGRAVIAFVFLYSGAYNIGCNPLPYTYTTELLPYQIRARGLSFEVAWDCIHGILGQYTNPIAMAAIGWKLYFFYTGMLVLTIVVVYYTFPETKGYTLEEIALLFDDAPEQIEAPAMAEISLTVNGVASQEDDSKEKV